MSGVKTEIRNLAEVQAALKRRGSAIAPAFRKAGAQARRLLVGFLAAYPDRREGQTYVRTEALKRGWERASPIETGLGFALINSVDHVSLVQGDDQAWMHKGRWQSARAIVDAHRAEVVALYAESIREDVVVQG